MGYESEDQTSEQLTGKRKFQNEIREQVHDIVGADKERMLQSRCVLEDKLVPDIEEKKKRRHFQTQLPPDEVLNAYNSMTFDKKEVEEYKKIQDELDAYVAEESDYDDKSSPIFLDKGEAPSVEEQKKATEEAFSRGMLPVALDYIKNVYMLATMVQKELDDGSFSEAEFELNRKSSGAFHKLESAAWAIDVLKSFVSRPAFEPVEGYDDITDQELIDSEKEYLSTDPGIYHRSYNEADSNDLSLYFHELAAHIDDEQKLNPDNISIAFKGEDYEVRNFNYWSKPKDQYIQDEREKLDKRIKENSYSDPDAVVDEDEDDDTDFHQSVLHRED